MKSTGQREATNAEDVVCVFLASLYFLHLSFAICANLYFHMMMENY